MMNEVANFRVRHFTDQLILSIYSKSTDPTLQPTCIFTTKVELNNLELNEDKVTVLVVGTNAMRTKGQPLYFTFELDLLFNARL
jgi:hypothetical protein